MLRLGTVALLLVGWTPAHAQDCLTVISQNALHFGYDDPGTKEEKLEGLEYLYNKYRWKKDGDEVVVLGIQELMDRSYDPWSNGKWLTTYEWSLNSYSEAYGFLLDQNFTKNADYVDFPWDLEDIDVNLVDDFARPPGGVLVSCGDGTDPDENIWILNIHVIWGKTASGRNEELKAAADAIEAYLGCTVDPDNPGSCVSPTSDTWTANNAVMVGDWNRNRNAINRYLCDNISSTYECYAFLDEKTSVNRKTAKYSSPYDHLVAVWKTTDPMPTDATRLDEGDYDLTSLRDYVDEVSDHMGVYNDAL